ncbi:hypothetical protein MTR67_036323 [Solanum verrucosum]|uniref:MULE transposase domain-containing protein n=1 Tax=Solanum verrucosum TaxID=315347 RepID=A0AAF0UBG9_SOLVR|nr:hypothetical protein MTR67_036323 [Solanum verrucosum]
MEYATESRRTTIHLPSPCFTKKGTTTRETSSQCEQFFSVVLAEGVQGGSVLSLRDNVIGVVQDNMIGEEDGEDYHDDVIERRGMKAKESDYDDSDELLKGGTDSKDEVEYTEYNAENDNPILEVGMKFASFDQFKEEVFNIFRVDPTWNVSGIIAIVQKDLGYIIEYKKAWRAKQQALKWVYGDEGAQYGKLLRYRADLVNTNSSSNVEIWRDECKFKGFYMCLDPLKEAFKSGCRPLISLDGCWLKGTYRGNLLAAIAIDPNDCIFPVVYVVISDAESKETWSWFLTNLGYDLQITNSHHIAFMSDRQKGLIGVDKELFLEAEHRNCARHMYQNFRQKHKGKALKDLVWNVARASNEVKFKICMERLEQEDREARKWFDHPERPFQTWTRALFKTHSRCDMLLNNLCESFNRYILDVRDKSIIALLKMIKNKLMKRLYKKKEWINKYQDQFNHDMWDNSQLKVDLTNQSIVTQELRQQSTGVECVQDEVVRVTDIINVNDEGADYVRGAQSAQDEGIDCARRARCALEKSDDCMRGAQCD